ncbi:hypothetical protein BpHYR1_053348 [Brachionus plicatilis]|uniref:Uncharacterized protein n=1 Tax=Brachionus plicatilis TaxID=10195 RepID=A0A3M7PJN5_BRAPC|nr:hypothetical protein BpHYR1_053348 [Brachionus plicatilis]
MLESVKTLQIKTNLFYYEKFFRTLHRLPDVSRCKKRCFILVTGFKQKNRKKKSIIFFLIKSNNGFVNCSQLNGTLNVSADTIKK